TPGTLKFWVFHFLWHHDLPILLSMYSSSKYFPVSLHLPHPANLDPPSKILTLPEPWHIPHSYQTCRPVFTLKLVLPQFGHDSAVWATWWLHSGQGPIDITLSCG